ncbi:MAG: NAD(P)-dependent oxidoreductase [Lentisphaeria bacterium]
MLSLIHIANRKPHPGIFPQKFVEELEKIGELTIIKDGKELSEDEKMKLLQKADVALTGWNSCPLPAAIAEDPGKLKYVCNITGEMSGFVPREIIASDILVSNWGDTPAIAIAEGTVTLLLATLKDLHHQIMKIREDEWNLPGRHFGGSLYNAPLGVYGCGAIGERFVNLVKPFEPRISIYDPYCSDIPADCRRVKSLRELFEHNKIIVVCAGLSDETRGSVTAELLALLPDNGVLVNTARGAIIDQDALFAELESGRLRAGLDVLEPERLPEGHPARKWRNCILTAHEINRGWPDNGEKPKELGRMHKICLENLQALKQGKPIKFEMDVERFDRSS